jgi:glutathione S-transferase
VLQLHTWTTPNGIKPIILLEELETRYELRWVNIGNGQQHDPSYLRINPNVVRWLDKIRARPAVQRAQARKP